jgi:Zn-dependent peptidase ImmA (M78 family)
VRRGFKAEAERLAERIRTQLGLHPHDRVEIRQLAKHLNVEVIPADRLVDRARLEELERIQPGAFSAATFHLPEGRTIAVYNPCSREPGRTNSDIGHEIAHILLDHDVREIQQIAGHTFITCNPEQEEEATWLAGCLLLPRPPAAPRGAQRHQRRGHRRQVRGQPAYGPVQAQHQRRTAASPPYTHEPDYLTGKQSRGNCLKHPDP